MTADEFNGKYPVGTTVRYWPGARDGEGRVGTTRSKAWTLGGHTPVVLITGYAGGVALTHVEVDFFGTANGPAVAGETPLTEAAEATRRDSLEAAEAKTAAAKTAAEAARRDPLEAACFNVRLAEAPREPAGVRTRVADAVAELSADHERLQRELTEARRRRDANRARYEQVAAELTERVSAAEAKVAALGEPSSLLKAKYEDAVAGLAASRQSAEKFQRDLCEALAINRDCGPDTILEQASRLHAIAQTTRVALAVTLGVSQPGGAGPPDWYRDAIGVLELKAGGASSEQLREALAALEARRASRDPREDVDEWGQFTELGDDPPADAPGAPLRPVWKAVYTAVKQGGGRHWQRVGAAFLNQDRTLTVRLYALPVDGCVRVGEPARRSDT